MREYAEPRRDRTRPLRHLRQRNNRSYAQPFERHHLQKHKMRLTSPSTANSPTISSCGISCSPTIITICATNRYRNLHARAEPQTLRAAQACSRWCARSANASDGAYSMVLLNAMGDMLVARDPLGIKPLCYAKEGPLFAAASENIALINLGFKPESVKSLPQAMPRRSRTANSASARDQSAQGALLLRMDLFRQRRQHAGRAAFIFANVAGG